LKTRNPWLLNRLLLDCPCDVRFSGVPGIVAEVIRMSAIGRPLGFLALGIALGFPLPLLSQDCLGEVGSCEIPALYPRKIAVSGQFAYVAAPAGGDLYTGRFSVVDISDPVNPEETGFIEWCADPRGIAVSAGYAYVSVRGTPCVPDWEDQFHIKVIDVSDPTSPKEVATTPGIVGHYGLAISGSLLYAASDEGLRIYDISSPTSPSLVGFNDSLGYLYDVDVQGSYAYVVYGGAGFKVVDVSDPQNPTEVGHVSMPVNPFAVVVVGGVAFVAGYGYDVRVVDISDPTDPQFVRAIIGTGGTYNLAISGDYLYVPSNELRVVEIVDPLNPTVVGEAEISGVDVAVADGLAYLLTFDLIVLDVSCFESFPGTTIITHGFQLDEIEPPPWTFAMANAVADRAGWGGKETGQVLEYVKNTGELVPCQSAQCTAEGEGETVVVLDWADDSNEAGGGFSEAAAESFFAALIEGSQEDPPLVNLNKMHFIGHSRGTIVNSEIAERLIAAGYPPPQQMTTLDPHDAGAVGDAPEEGFSWDDYDVNKEHPEYDCHGESSTPGVCAWEGVGYQDNYWQDELGCPFPYHLNGLELYGSSNFHQNDLEINFCHSDTHIWYYFTIDTIAETHPTEGRTPGDNWFGEVTGCTGLGSPREAPMTRGFDGYNLSRIGGSYGARCPYGPGEKQEVLFDFRLKEGLVNGDFERPGVSGQTAGWSFHGGGLEGEIRHYVDYYLALSGGEWAQHNRFYMPEDAGAIGYCRQVVDPGESDGLSLVLARTGVPDREMLPAAQQVLSVETDWECFRAPVTPDEQGKAVQIMFSVSSALNPTVYIDDIRISGPGMFTDGFESGDTSAWTAAVP
jgi:hypothetical protein